MSDRPEGTGLERMLEARSVAVVGASAKPGSLGNQMMVELARGGYDGAVYPVNPGYAEVLGRRCYPSIGDVPEPVDLAILGVANARVEQVMRDAAAAGARSVVTFSSLYEPTPPEPGLPSLAQRLAGIAHANGMAVCGGNGMGFLQLESRVRATGFPTPDHLRVGPVALISHSGSAFAAFAFNDRGIGFNVVVSSGQEIVSTMADYMGYALTLPSTRVLALLLETIRDPDGFRDALRRAAELDVAVLALTMGRTQGAKAMVEAHSGALAGEHGAYEALFDAHGVHECRGLDEMADAIELFSSPRRARGDGGMASVHDSGGERALLVDLAHDVGVPLAQVTDDTKRRIDAVLDPGLTADNPLDAWGTGIDAERIFRESMVALHDDPDTAALAFTVDLTRQEDPADAGYLGVALDTWATTHKPFCVLSNLSSAIAHDQAGVLREAGIPVLEGTETGLLAIRHLFEDAGFRERPAIVPPEPVAPEVRGRWRDRLTVGGGPLPESSGFSLLADYGIPVTASAVVASAEQAIEAAEGRWPVALKTAADGVHHKSDVGGVRLGIEGPGHLRRAYEEMASRLGPRMTVAAMAPPGVEVALGIVRDPDLGPLIVVAAGGELVELIADRRLAVPPLDARAGRRLIDRLGIRELLDGVRGRPAADVDALATVIARLSLIATDLGDLVEALDVNPVICSSSGCVAVDALVLPRPRRPLGE